MMCLPWTRRVQAMLSWAQFTTSCGEKLRRICVPSPAFELEEIVRFGNAAGSLTTTKGGAIPAMPSMVEIQNCIASIPLM